ncbi:hypothetical protein F5Y00DRAFT_124625 [Daldinia vernicosa]|uniref:uncharacterized protein n=1 Tax=Daldinia vernicosa TaxID=114800 RepID=UPI002007BF33|nr:uncharacterized protein F5Y00DRAFT_124625 [Daldinia vernicosa]KAI0847058.1 hypothetical protein F5Y00DRAFT_124625 [Daldinia vernicosa]
MAVGWKTKTKVEWRHFMNFDPPVSCQLPITLHESLFTDLSQWHRLAGVSGQKDIVPRRSPLLWNVYREQEKFLQEEAAKETGVSYVLTTISLEAARQLDEMNDGLNGKQLRFPRPRESHRVLRSFSHDPAHTRPSKRSRSNGKPQTGAPIEEPESNPDDPLADNDPVAQPQAKEPQKKFLKTKYGTFELFQPGFWFLKNVEPDHVLKLPIGVGLRDELEPIMDYKEEVYLEDGDNYQPTDTSGESNSGGSQIGGEREMTERLASMDLMDADADPPYADIGLADDGTEVEDHEPIVEKEMEVMMIDGDLPDASLDVEDHEPRVDKGKGKEKEKVVIVIDDDSEDESYVARQNVLRDFGASSSNADPSNVEPKYKHKKRTFASHNQQPSPAHLPGHNNPQIARQAANMNSSPNSQRVGQALNLDDLYESLNPQNPTQADHDKYRKLVRLYPHLFRDDRTKLLPNGFISSSRLIKFDGQPIGIMHFFPGLLPVIPGYDTAMTIEYVLSGVHDRTRLEPWPFLWRILIKFDCRTIGTIELRHMPVPLPPPANPDGSHTDLLQIHCPLRSSNTPPVDLPGAPPVDKQFSGHPTSDGPSDQRSTSGSTTTLR